MLYKITKRIKRLRDFPGCPVVKNLPSNMGNSDSVLVRELRSYEPHKCGQRKSKGKEVKQINTQIMSFKKKKNRYIFKVKRSEVKEFKRNEKS